ncbi:MAG TPA: phytoene desaturase family protein [Segeticoccus sp.]|uniref:phytoene desaturase family protein n=1 Tax=Segeticoccus sp. TaxID=2706531 RepID=UPI002D808511|nr:phytoene desaturase family protein [Segeticoccus sp.]HET8600285.1 phytoene desaturase family protein [Segeticoccus sp.]
MHRPHDVSSAGLRDAPATSPRRVVVVGAGLAGLSAALHLAGRGCEVTVLEREPAVGGRAGRTVLPAPGGGSYHLDTGPTVLTMPELVHSGFAAVGEDPDRWLTLHRLDPAYRAQFADGTSLLATSNVPEMADRIGRLAGADQARGYLRYVDHVTRLYHLEIDQFIARNFDSPRDLLTGSLAKIALLRGFSRLAPVVGRYFSDERLQRLFSFQAMYAGLSPERALALYAVISYMDLVAGVFYPEGGMHAVPDAMARAAAAHGVQVCCDTAVAGTRWRGERVTEVVAADGRVWSCDALVVTTDEPVTREILGARGWFARRVARRRLRHSPSCVVLAAGVRRTWPGAAHHTIQFGRAWSTVFDDLDHGLLMRDPSFLVSLPTTTDPGLAPEGASSAYALFPAPNLTAGASLDWESLREPYRDHLVRAVERAGFAGFGAAVDAEVLLTPRDWAARGLAAGTPFAAAHTFTQTGPFRTPNVVADNVVLAGSSTVPGVGVPMVLISGRLAADRVTGPVPPRRARVRW